MSIIEAKQVSNKHWVLQQDHKKIGELTYFNKYSLSIKGYKNKLDFDTLDDLRDQTDIKFIAVKKHKVGNINKVHGYDTVNNAYNPVWNLLYKLPMFTTESDSKSWHCAGYYKIYINNKWTVEFCPKFITLERNKYTGPYKTKPELYEYNKFFNNK